MSACILSFPFEFWACFFAGKMQRSMAFAARPIISFARSQAILQPPLCVNCRRLAMKTDNPMNIFDRTTKRMQRNRTARLEDPAVYDYIKEEVSP